MVQRNTNQMDWHVAVGCCGSHAASVCLQFKINPQLVLHYTTESCTKDMSARVRINSTRFQNIVKTPDHNPSVVEDTSEDK